MYFSGQSHSGTIRASLELQGIFITGGEDSAIYAWSLSDTAPSNPIPANPPSHQLKKPREDRYYRPY